MIPPVSKSAPLAVLLAQGVLRLRIAVLVHAGSMAILAGIVAFDAADSLTVIAPAGIVAGNAARSRRMLTTFPIITFISPVEFYCNSNFYLLKFIFTNYIFQAFQQAKVHIRFSILISGTFILTQKFRYFNC